MPELFEIILLEEGVLEESERALLVAKLREILSIDSQAATRIVNSRPISLLKSSEMSALLRMANELKLLGAKTEIVTAASEKPQLDGELIGKYQECLEAFKNGELNRARAGLEELIVKIPKHPELHLNLAAVLSCLGCWEESEAAFQECLKLAPEHPAANLGLGNVCNQIGDYERALYYFSQAGIGNLKAKALSGSGIAHYGKGDFQKALFCFRDALNLDPRFEAAQYNVADCERRLGHLENAAAEYRKCLLTKPDHFEALCWLANTLMHLGQSDEAIEVFKRAREGKSEKELSMPSVVQAVKPFLIIEQQDFKSRPSIEEAQRKLENRDFAGAFDLFRALYFLGERSERELLGLAYALKGLQKWTEALVIFQEVLAKFDKCVEAIIGAAACLLEMGQDGEAMELTRGALQRFPNRPSLLIVIAAIEKKRANLRECKALLEQALKVDPKQPEAHHLMAEMASMRRQSDIAIKHFEKAIEGAPHDPRHHFQLAQELVRCKHYDQAERHFKKALSLDAANYQYMCELGLLYGHMDRPDEAEQWYQKALSINPECQLAINNLGNLKFGKREPKRGAELFTQLLKINKDNPGAVWNRSLVNLLNGNYRQGWRDFEARRRTWRELAQEEDEYWEGSSLEGKTILVKAEQGLGDCLMMARYLPLLLEKKARVIVEMYPALMRLFESIPGIEVVEYGGELPPHDLFCLMMSFPAIFKTTLKNIPRQVPYFTAPEHPPIKTRGWRHPRIGFVFRGSLLQGNNHQRSCPLSELAALFDICGATFVCLQKELRYEDYEILKDLPHVKVVADKLGDMADTAAIIKDLDLVISVDTSIAHLTGALGKPLWALLSANSSWQWLMDREDSPWYPTARLFRQEQLGEWKSVIRQMRVELRKMFPTITLPEDIEESKRGLMALEYLRDGNLPAARSAISDLEATDSKAIFVKAECLRLEKQLVAAEELFCESLQLSQHDAQSLRGLALIYLEREEFDLAEKAARQAATHNKEPSLLSLLATVLIKAKKFQEAYQVCVSSIKEVGENAELNTLAAEAAMALQMKDDAQALAERALTLSPHDTDPRLILAQLMSSQGNFTSAISQCREAVALDPDNQSVLSRAAQIAIECGEDQEALNYYRTILKGDEWDLEALESAADLLYEGEDYKSALTLYLKAVQADPSRPMAHYKLGRTFLRLGNLVEAKQCAYQLEIMKEAGGEPEVLSRSLSRELSANV